MSPSINKAIHVVVLMGGWSSEREVSLTSGRGVAEALRERGWSHVTELDMDRNVSQLLTALRPDVVFNALHGTPGEDGTVQGLLDLMQVPYTHSGLTTSAIAIDKELTKRVLEPHGVRMPAGKVVESESLYREDPIARPYVVKPVNEGSSVGVAIVTADGNYGSPIGRDVEGPWQHFDHLLAEPFIKGRELTVAVLGDEALAVTELKPVAGFYDYDAKYTDGLTVHVCPAEVPEDIARSMLDMAAKAHRLLGCRGASRSDFRWDDEAGEAGIYLLEINTQPGMTPLSLVPEQAKYRGISYGELVERLIEEALDGGGSS
jgi:D-alanine-D-alanine ligase